MLKVCQVDLLEQEYGYQHKSVGILWLVVVIKCDVSVANSSVVRRPKLVNHIDEYRANEQTGVKLFQLIAFEGLMIGRPSKF